MKITDNGSVLVVEDGPAANLGLGILVPALAVGVFSWLIWPPIVGGSQLLGSVFAAVVTGLSLAVLTPPHTTECDRNKREVHLTVGWPPICGREETISIADIRNASVWRLIDLGDLGSARPALNLKSGRMVMLSGYRRSPEKCWTVVGAVNGVLGDIA